MWISGLEAVGRRIGLRRAFDLSATPFFLRGSGYAEGTLFPWTMSDFSLMDAIECGIVKLPRVPVADNIPSAEMPRFRELWKHIGPKMPKAGRGRGGAGDPLGLPVELQSALEALYGHYERVFEQWRAAGAEAPPCFIVVCNNTSTSKLVHDYIAGFRRENADDSTTLENGRLPLFRNFDDDGRPLARPRTLLIDSEQLESGEALDRDFRRMAADAIERFKRERVARTGDRRQADAITDQELLREVMNTVGRPGRLGHSIRCVVSIAMLTEGWDANTVTHVLGVRAFGTQLLCEQVVGRALRRQSYDVNADGRLDPEYADVLGIPFDFTAEPVVVKPKPPRPTVLIHAVSPDRDACELTFPRVAGYRVELPADRIDARFDADATLVLDPQRVGPTRTRNEGIIGEGVDLDTIASGRLRRSTLLFHLTRRLVDHWRDGDGAPKLHLFGQLKRIAGRWLDEHLVCTGGTQPAQLLYPELAEEACERITNAIVLAERDRERPVAVTLDPCTPVGSTRHVRFSTSKPIRWRTDPRRCHVNQAVCDSAWEADFCRVLEAHPRVRAWVCTRRPPATATWGAPARARLGEERRAGLRRSLPPGRQRPPLRARFHRPRRRGPRRPWWRRRSATPGSRDQGLSR